MNHKAYIKNKASGAIKSYKEVCNDTNKRKTKNRFPDLTEFRKSIHCTGESLAQTVIKGRG